MYNIIALFCIYVYFIIILLLIVIRLQPSIKNMEIHSFLGIEQKLN